MKVKQTSKYIIVAVLAVVLTATCYLALINAGEPQPTAQPTDQTVQQLEQLQINLQDTQLYAANLQRKLTDAQADLATTQNLYDGLVDASEASLIRIKQLESENVKYCLQIENYKEQLLSLQRQIIDLTELNAVLQGENIYLEGLLNGTVTAVPTPIF